MKKVKKILFLVLVMVLFVIVNFNVVYGSSIIDIGKDWINTGTQGRTNFKYCKCY